MILSRLFFLGFLSLFLFPALAQAGQLTIAVVQYTDARTAETLVAAFAGAELTEITNSDKVESKDSAIKGGRVLFATTMPVFSESSLVSSTRLGAQRVELSVRFSPSNLKVEVTLQDGVDIGIRKFSRNVFTGSGPLNGSEPTIISIRESTGKTQSAVKGKATLKTYNFSTLVVAQWKK